MIDPATLASFALASALLILVPGPNIAVITATGAVHGRNAAFAVVAGTTIAQAVQIALAVGGLAALLAVFGWALAAVKWAGVAYLVWTGVKALRARAPEGGSHPISNRRFFATGAATALANPKTLMFHAAFLPLFVQPGAPAGVQLFILAATFIAIAVVLDMGYAMLSGSLRRVTARPGVQAIAKRVSGATLLAAAGWLALRRTH